MIIKSVEIDYKIKCNKFEMIFEAAKSDLYILADGQKIRMKDGDKIAGLIKQYSKGKMEGKEFEYARLTVEGKRYEFTLFYTKDGKKESETTLL